jgi:hypothetical protein
MHTRAPVAAVSGAPALHARAVPANDYSGTDSAESFMTPPAGATGGHVDVR